MNVVFANQSPTLMNILASSSKWSLSWVPTQDHEDVAEMRLMEARRFTGGNVEAALVCAPSQIDFMRRMFPRAKILWVAHNGYVRQPAHVFRGVDACVAFSSMVSALTKSCTGLPSFFVSPAYEPRRLWTWKNNDFVTIKSRPARRIDDVSSVASYVLAGMKHTYYGQDQPGGFVSGDAKLAVLRSSSAYASMLHRSAGFGLAEHEAMSVGAPVLGGFWGDMEIEAPKMPSLHWSLRQLRGIAATLAQDEAFAKECSEASLDYIHSYRTRERMDETIESLVDSIRAL